MSDLNEQGQRLLALLVEKLESVVPGNPATYTSYQAVHEELGLQLRGRTYGESLKYQGLNSLADWTKAEGKPGITGIIVDQSRLRSETVTSWGTEHGFWSLGRRGIHSLPQRGHLWTREQGVTRLREHG